MAVIRANARRNVIPDEMHHDKVTIGKIWLHAAFFWNYFDFKAFKFE
ncbi:hypothetical protein L0128_15620 [candidate division KSB1 bacterium]|nr:hypothetical protein [candidate division KSB1 bacterium]